MMSKISRRTMLAITGLATVAGGLLALPSKRSWATTLPREKIRARYFPNVALITHEGKEVRFYDDLLKDKFVTLNFVYTSCAVSCPITTANLVQVQKILKDRVGRDFFMYSISLDPERDTPKVLKKYAEKFGVGPGWLFLTAKSADTTELLRRSLGYVNPIPEVDRDKGNHIGLVKYGNEPLMQWGAVPGMGNPKWIAKSILFADWPEKKTKCDCTPTLSG